MDTYKKEL